MPGSKKHSTQHKRFKPWIETHVFETATSPAIELCWSPTGEMIACGFENGLIRIINLEAEEVIAEFREPVAQDIGCLAWEPNESRLAVGGSSDSAKISLWNVSNASLIAVSKVAHPEMVFCLAWSANLLLSSTNDRRIRAWNTDNLNLLRERTVPMAIECAEDADKTNYSAYTIGSLCFSPTKNEVLAVGFNVRPTIFTSPAFAVKEHIPEVSPGTTSEGSWSRDGRTIACSAGTTVRILDAQTMSVQKVIETSFKQHAGRLSFSCDGSALAIEPVHLDADCIRIYSLETNELVQEIDAIQSEMNPRNQRIAIIDRAGNLRIFSPGGTKHVHRFALDPAPNATPQKKEQGEGNQPRNAGTAIDERMPQFEEARHVLHWNGLRCEVGNNQEAQLIKVLIKYVNRFVSHDVILTRMPPDSAPSLKHVKRRLVKRLRVAEMGALASAIKSQRNQYGLFVEDITEV